MSDWLKIASKPSTVKRALKYAAIVGPILISINHGKALLNGEISLSRIISMCLTMAVPFCVSTASSVSATREFRKKRATDREALLHLDN